MSASVYAPGWALIINHVWNAVVANDRQPWKGWCPDHELDYFYPVYAVRTVTTAEGSVYKVPEGCNSVVRSGGEPLLCPWCPAGRTHRTLVRVEDTFVCGSHAQTPPPPVTVAAEPWTDWAERK